jgi:hypothetical protein
VAKNAKKKNLHELEVSQKFQMLTGCIHSLLDRTGILNTEEGKEEKKVGP